VSQGHEQDSQDSEESAEWSDLERGFFEAAPPEVAVTPPQAMSFDDLDRPEGVGVKGSGRKRRERRVRPRRVRAAAPGAASLLFWKVARVVGGAARRARAWAQTKTFLTRHALGPLLAEARDVVTRTVSPLIERIRDEIPGERPEARTVVVGIVTAFLVLGLSATVLGSRGAPWVEPPAASAPAAGSDGPSDPALKCPAALAPAPVAVVQPLEPELTRHVAAPRVQGAAKGPHHVHQHALRKATPAR
jgi:hypothetical protein